MTTDQPATPQPPHPLGALTTTELSRYRRELERAVSDKTIGSAPIAADLKTKLDEVLNEEVQRAQIRNAGRTWPVSN
jgi:hypothetical protein